jgi:GMP synthase (glutamine-hydrolysing)
MKPFLILQLRPEDPASDGEYQAFLRAGGLQADDTKRIRMEAGGLPELDLDEYSGVIVGGGPYNVSDKEKPEEQIKLEQGLHAMFDKIVERDFPYFGACYGLGVLSDYLGGTVSKEKYSETLGAVTVKLTADGEEDGIFGIAPEEFRAFVGHKEACQNVPEGAVLLAGTETCPVQAIRVKKNIFATQFHPELDSDGLAVRIEVYRYAGYFPPEQADELKALAAKETVTEPERIFRKFIETYKRT